MTEHAEQTSSGVSPWLAAGILSTGLVVSTAVSVVTFLFTFAVLMAVTAPG